MRYLLKALAARGVLIEYRVGMFTGQRLRVWAEDGLPHNMSPGTAKAYLRRLEAKEWGLK
jgi:hypothetical protein